MPDAEDSEKSDAKAENPEHSEAQKKPAEDQEKAKPDRKKRPAPKPDSMTDSLDQMPTGSLDDDPANRKLVPDHGAVVYALEPKETPSDEDDSNFWSKLPFLKNRKKKK